MRERAKKQTRAREGTRERERMKKKTKTYLSVDIFGVKITQRNKERPHAICSAGMFFRSSF